MLVQDGLPPRERAQALLVIILGITMAVLDGTIVNLALPDITRELQATASQSIWIINAYQMATLSLLLPLATLGDLFGYRRIYIMGLLTCTLASLACAMADSLATLAFARVLQGMGAAGIMSVNGALVRLIYPRNLLGRGIAINSLVVATASVAGPTLAAAILSVASWPWLFAINIPIGLLCLALAPKVLPPNTAKANGTRISWLDVVLNISMFSLIVLGIDGLSVHAEGLPGQTLGKVPGWLPVAELAAGLAIGVFYVRRQLSQPVPLFPVDLLRIPVFALSMGTSVSAFCAQTLAYIGLPFLLLGSFGRNHIETGLLLTAWPLGIVVTAPFVGRLIGRYSGGVLGGIGLFQSPNNHLILTSAPAHRSGGASGMLGTARLTGQTLGAVLLALVFGLFDPQTSQGPLVALWLGAGFAAAAACFSVLRVRQQ